MLDILMLFSCVASTETVQPQLEDSGFDREEYSIILIADPHIVDGGEHRERLSKTVNWINENKDIDEIELVFVLGDVGWGDGLTIAKEELQKLSVPFVPVIGDNEVHFGDEMRFFDVFSDTYNDAALRFHGWNDSFSTVWNPLQEQESMFGNFSFSHRGIQYIGLDWAARVSGILGEMGDLHDFSGGSFPWLSEELAILSENDEPIFFLSHIPMYMNAGAFDIAEMDSLDTLLASYSDRIVRNFAGHYHADVENEQTHYDLVVIDAIWDDEIRFQRLNVRKDRDGFLFSHDLITIE